MDIPWQISLAAWLPFPVVATVVLVLSISYYVYHLSSARCSMVCGVAFALLTTIPTLLVVLILTDVFFVSSTKSNMGIKQAWATNQSIAKMEEMLLFTYYGVYGLLLLLLVIIFPITYFSYQAIRTAESSRWNIFRGLMCSLLPMVVLVAILIVSMAYSMGSIPASNTNTYKQLNLIGQLDLPYRRIEDGLISAINCILLIGMIHCIIYTAFGMAILPVNLVKGRPNDDREQQGIEESLAQINQQIEDISDQAHQENRNVSENDEQRICFYSNQLNQLQMESENLRHRSYSCWRRLNILIRPLQITTGVVLCLFSWLIIITIVLTNINRWVSSYGSNTGYLADKYIVPNPVYELLLLCHGAFPIHYVLLGGILFYFAFSTMVGMKHLGLWFFWVKVHNIRKNNTLPHALLYSSFIFATVVMYSVSLVYSIVPQYAMYGTQTYQVETQFNWTTVAMENSLNSLKPCSLESPADECTMTRFMSFQVKFFYRMWVFGVVFYSSNWLLVLVFVIGFFVSVIRFRKTAAENLLNQMRSESQEQLVQS
ncbi:lysosomal cobalamin transport escort protein LMBD1-like [Ciona intestinalis]